MATTTGQPHSVEKEPTDQAGNGTQRGGLTELWDRLSCLLEKLTAHLEKLTAFETERNAAGQEVVQYSRYEKWVARLMLIYLLAAFLFGFWAMADAFHGGTRILSWFRSTQSAQGTGTSMRSADPPSTPSASTDVAALSSSPGKSTETVPGTSAADTFILLATSAGWLGATIAAMRSLCDHYAAPVENASDLCKQEALRFHPQWSIRWVAGPLMGASLALMVFALVQSGVLPFAIGQYSAQDVTQDNVTVKNEFAAIGFGGLIGLAAKDVIEKLIQVVKSALGVEEPKDKALQVSPANASVQFGGEPIRFAVDPDIPVTWTVEPAVGSGVGCFANGIFRPADGAPKDIPGSYAVIVTATARLDPTRSASAILTLNRPA